MNLPSLLAFQPRFYCGGAIRHHLALLYDLVALRRPERLVVDGFGDGEAFFTLCQAVRETALNCTCTAIWRGATGETSEADQAWLEGRHYAAANYGEFARLSSDPAAMARVDLLLIEERETGAEITAGLDHWQSALSSAGIVAVHGLALERDDSPAAAWEKWREGGTGARFSAGIGLGLAPSRDHPQDDRFPFASVAPNENALSQLYALASARIEAQARNDLSQRDLAALTARQVWLDSVLEDRAGAMAEMKETEVILRRDRAKAQLVMESQEEQLRVWVAELDSRKQEISQLKARVREHKQILSEAKSACRLGGKCFRAPGAPKERRPLAARIAREIRRIPVNLGLRRPDPPLAKPGSKRKQTEPVDRYAAWREEHEPNEAALAAQRLEAAQWRDAPTISLLLPVKDPPEKFLEELLASIVAQTAANWELCLVDGGSIQSETLATIKRWNAHEPRIRSERLEENLGISENTNRALMLASGEFIACIDHDDLLAPFAIYELSRAILAAPEAEIFYSDEDRCDLQSRRFSPFFKPEWNPSFSFPRCIWVI